jgi:hypothetical protein
MIASRARNKHALVETELPIIEVPPPSRDLDKLAALIVAVFKQL